MRRALLSVVPIVVVVMTACAARMHVSSHVERGLDFSQYRTYDWGPADALPTGDPRLDANPVFKDQLQGAVERRLAARGLALSAETPHLLIHYHASVTDRIDLDRLDRAYGYGEHGSQPPVTIYEAGTIVLDFIDARTNRLIWRGWVQNRAEDFLGNPAQMVKTIDESMALMLQRLP